MNNDGYNKNIADLAGNIWEWNAEVYKLDGDDNRWAYRRGGSAWDTFSNRPVSSITSNHVHDYDNNYGFRVVLYIE